MDRAGEILDLSRPVGLLLIGVMGHIVDPDEAFGVVRGLLEPLASGSYLILHDSTDENAAFNAAQAAYDETGAIPFRLRSRVHPGVLRRAGDRGPGLVTSGAWRPEVGGWTSKIFRRCARWRGNPDAEARSRTVSFPQRCVKL